MKYFNHKNRIIYHFSVMTTDEISTVAATANSPVNKFRKNSLFGLFKF